MEKINIIMGLMFAGITGFALSSMIGNVYLSSKKLTSYVLTSNADFMIMIRNPVETLWMSISSFFKPFLFAPFLILTGLVTIDLITFIFILVPVGLLFSIATFYARKNYKVVVDLKAKTIQVRADVYKVGFYDKFIVRGKKSLSKNPGKVLCLIPEKGDSIMIDSYSSDEELTTLSGLIQKALLENTVVNDEPLGR